MSDPLRTLSEANPVPRESVGLTPGEEARLSQMVQSRMAGPVRMRGPIVALASAMAVVVGFVWLALVGIEPPTDTTVFGPDTTTTVAVEPTTTAIPPTTVPSTTTTTPPSAPPVVIEWTRITVPNAPGGMRAIRALDDGFVAVGHVDSSFTEGDAAVWLSPDGEIWNRVSDDGSIFGGEGFQNAVDLVVDGDRVVVAGLSYAVRAVRGVVTTAEGLYAPLVWLSEDAGETWRRIEPEGPGYMYSIAMVDGGYVAAGSGFWYSEDGVDWTKVDESLGLGYIGGIAESPDGLVAVAGPDSGEGWSAVAVSESGVVWERVPHDDAVFGEPDPRTGLNWVRTVMTDVVWTGERFVAVGDYAEGSHLEGAAWLSDDGWSWSLVTDPALGGSGSQFVSAVAFDGSRLYAVGHLVRQDERGQALAWVSTDGGSSWTAAESVGSGFDAPLSANPSPIDVLVDGERLIAVGYFDDSATVWVGSIQE